MDKRIIGRTGVEASRLGFGAMRLPQKDGGIDFELSCKMIDLALEAGVNYFDTGYNYHSGMSEVFLGKALAKHRRESYVLTTKLSLLTLMRGENPTRELAEQMFDEQLERLGVDYFDFYLIHNISDDTRRALIHELDLVGMLMERKRRGQIRFTGFSSHDKAENMGKCLDLADWDVAQIQLNYFDWEYQNARLTCQTLKERGVALIAMEPVRGGRLTTLPAQVESALRAGNPNESNAAWALRWVANETDAAIVLSGMSNMEQLEENIKTFSPVQPFSDNERKAVSNAANLLLNAPIVACTACEYCLPCPVGVKIPQNFDIYNEYIRFENAQTFKTQYSKLAGDGSSGAEACIACGKCISDCPQSVNIPEELKKIALAAR